MKGYTMLLLDSKSGARGWKAGVNKKERTGLWNNERAWASMGNGFRAACIL